MIDEYLSPGVDTLGINEDDLVDILMALEEHKLAKKIEQQKSSIHTFEGLLHVLEESNFKEFLLHHQDFIIDITKGCKRDILYNRRFAIEFGALVCAARAYKGIFPTIDEIKRYFFNKYIFINQRGIEECKKLREFLIKKGFSETNYLIFEGKTRDTEITISIVPTLASKRTRKTVGLGDTFAVSFGIGEGITRKEKLF